MQLFHSVISAIINLAVCSSVVFICHPSLSKPFFFGLFAGCHIALRVLDFCVCSVFLHMTPVYTLTVGVGFPFSYHA